MRKNWKEPAWTYEVRPLAAAELLRCRGGGDHEDQWLWVVMGTLPPWDGPIDPLTGTGPTFPPPRPG